VGALNRRRRMRAVGRGEGEEGWSGVGGGGEGEEEERGSALSARGNHEKSDEKRWRGGCVWGDGGRGCETATIEGCLLGKIEMGTGGRKRAACDLTTPNPARAGLGHKKKFTQENKTQNYLNGSKKTHKMKDYLRPAVTIAHGRKNPNKND